MRIVFSMARQRFHQSRSMEKFTRKGVILLVMVAMLYVPDPLSSQESEFSKRLVELSDRLAFATKGEILAVKGKTVYLNLGQRSGIIKGTKFEVVRLGEPLMSGGKVFGYEETIIGQIETFRVRATG